MAEKDEALKKAITAVGGKAEDLAAKLGITPQAISQWEQVPLLRVPDVERITGISRYDLRPDFFGTPSDTSEVA